MNPLDTAIQNLGIKRSINIGGENINLACLLRDEDTRPLQAKWWKGKQSTLLAVDDDGNFILRHSGGHVIYWNHAQQSEKTIAKSVSDFIKMIEQGEHQLF